MKNIASHSAASLPPTDDDLLAGVTGEDTLTQAGIVSGNRSVEEATAVLRAAVAELHQSDDQAWRRYGAEVNNALTHMDCELQITAALLRAERANSRQDLESALHEAATVVRGRIDDLRVQASLGEMDVRDLVVRRVEQLNAAGHQVQAVIDSLLHDATPPLDALRLRTAAALREVRAAVRGVLIAAKDELSTP